MRKQKDESGVLCEFNEPTKGFLGRFMEKQEKFFAQMLPLLIVITCVTTILVGIKLLTH